MTMPYTCPTMPHTNKREKLTINKRKHQITKCVNNEQKIHTPNESFQTTFLFATSEPQTHTQKINQKLFADQT